MNKQTLNKVRARLEGYDRAASKWEEVRPVIPLSPEEARAILDAHDALRDALEGLLDQAQRTTPFAFGPDKYVACRLCGYLDGTHTPECPVPDARKALEGGHDE